LERRYLGAAQLVGMTLAVKEEMGSPRWIRNGAA
jgi:hypothetical protein